MATSFDINLLPLVRLAGKDQYDVPGLHAASPPRRTARGRGSDQLVVYFALTGNAPLARSQHDQLLAHLAQTYYQTPGSVTAALRAAAETLNQSLLERNLQQSNTGRQSVGLLTLVVVRGDNLYLAQSGPVHAFLITAGRVQHQHDPDLTGHGLGVGRLTPVRYFQASLQPNDSLVLASQPASTWNVETLAGLYGQGPEGQRRRLLLQAGSDLGAVLMQVKPGSGKINVIRSQPAPQTDVAAVKAGPEKAAPTSVPEAAAADPTPAIARPAEPSIAEPAPVEVAQDAVATATYDLEDSPLDEGPASVLTTDEVVQPLTGGTAEPVLPGPVEAGFEATDEAVSAPAAASKQRRSQTEAGPRRGVSFAPVVGGLAAITRPLGQALGSLGRGIRNLLVRMLPGEALFTIPASTMAFIAIAVPLVVVTVASVVYLQRGLAVQYQTMLDQAVLAAQDAEGQTEPQARRAAWETTLYFVDKAERYNTTPETQSLRTRAWSAMDELENVRRPNYQPAIISGLPDEVNVTRMIIADRDLYMLDSSVGRVLRAEVTGQGYRLDPSFQCSRGSSGSRLEGPIIDIVPWPLENTPQASVVGMDAKGNLLYCQPNKPPEAGALTPASAQTWGSPVALALDVSSLYVLDPSANAVWIYWRGNVSNEPTFFFGDEIPPMLDVVDLAVNNDELYLLHSDGHLTLCIYSGLNVAPTRCTDPATYVDSRPGKEGLPMSVLNPFSQVLFTLPPDPSLYLLEPKSRAIYHFSLRHLALQRQFIPRDGLAAGPATAFTVNHSDRVLFLAIGNSVYYANIP